VRDGHLRQAEDHNDRDQRRDRIADQDAWTGIADRYAAPHEKAGANRAANADHCDLPLCQGFIQAAFT